MIRELLIPKSCGGAMQWVTDSAIRNGLPVSTDCTACVYERSGTLYLLSGQYGGYGMIGWYWNGSAWVSQNSETNYMTSVFSYTYPNAWYDGSSLMFTGGNQGGDFLGYFWDYSWWDYSTAVAGLGDIGSYSKPATIKIGSDIYLLVTEDSAVINGYKWNGSGWSSNTTILSGISDPPYGQTGFAYFELNGDTYLLHGITYIGWLGYKWNGSGWDSYNSCVAGLPALSSPAPDIFAIGSDIYMIAGTYRYGFKGFKLQV